MTDWETKLERCKTAQDVQEIVAGRKYVEGILPPLTEEETQKARYRFLELKNAV